MAEPIIDKLRKLFALADEGSGATEAERENAAAQAAKLMAKYDIERSEVGEDAGPAPETGLMLWRTITRDELWIQILATAVSMGLGSPVEVFGRKQGTGRAIYMVGSPVKVEFVQRLTEYLIPQLKIECEAALLRRKEQREKVAGEIPEMFREFYGVKPWGAGDTRAFRQAFLKTAPGRIKARIEDAYNAETEGVSTALVVRDAERNAEFLEENNMRIRQSKTKVSSAEGVRAGHDAAGSVDIHPDGKVESGAVPQSRNTLEASTL